MCLCSVCCQKTRNRRDSSRTITVEPVSRPCLRSSIASFTRSSGYAFTFIVIGFSDTSSKNSRPSCTVRFATDSTRFSFHSVAYGKEGISLMWMPAHTTMPPFFTASSADTTSGPSLAKMMHASSFSGGRLPLPPAQHAPSDRANSCFRASPSRVNTKQRMPMWRAS